MFDANQIDLWELPLNVSSAALQDYATMLSAPEQRKAKSLRFARDSARYVASHGLVRKILGQYLSVQPADVELELGRHGKPRLASSHHAVDLNFNYSHSDDKLLLAVTGTRELGIDIERQRADIEIFDIAAQRFSPIEQQIIRRAAIPEATFFRCWTAKEAVVKAMGSGLSQQLNEFTTLADEHSLVSRVRVAHSAEITYTVTLQALPMDDDCFATLAVVVEEYDSEPTVVIKALNDSRL